MTDNELTPLANVAFKGAVAEEINRLMRTIKNIVASGDDLADYVQYNMVCNCARDNRLCNKCEMLNRWDLVRHG